MWLIAVLMGFLGAPPLTIEIYFIANLLSQLWQHNEWFGRAGPLEWIFTTPSHHRVHHARDAAQMNANYGEVLIVWDRLFGTFQAECAERVTCFGLEQMPAPEASPVAIAFGEWRLMLGDLLAARMSWPPPDRGPAQDPRSARA